MSEDIAYDLEPQGSLNAFVWATSEIDDFVQLRVADPAHYDRPIELQVADIRQAAHDLIGFLDV